MTDFLRAFWAMVWAPDDTAPPADQTRNDGFHMAAGSLAWMIHPWAGAAFLAAVVVAQFASCWRDARAGFDAVLDIAFSLAGLALAALLVDPAGGPLAATLSWLAGFFALWLLSARVRGLGQ